MKKKHKKIKLSVGGIISIFLIIGITFLINNNIKNEKLLENTKSLISLQDKYEKNFSTKGYTIEEPNIILDPYKSSPLTALVLFETEENVSPKVTIIGKDESTTFTHTFKETKDHYLSIYGLYPDKENQVEISYEQNGKQVKKTLQIKTEQLPEDFIIPTKVIADKEYLGNELYFFTPSSKGYTCAYDINGDVRWYLSNYALWDNTRLQNGHMLISTERLINTPYYMTGLYEIDMLGKIYTEYSLLGGYHHDYFEMPNGNLLVASDDFYNESGTVEDFIVELDRKSGEIVKKIDLKDILKMEDGQNENWSNL